MRHATSRREPTREEAPARPRPATARAPRSAAAIARRANGNAALSRRLARSPAMLARTWEPDDPSISHWVPDLGPLRWWHNSETNLMWYTIVGETTEPERKKYTELAGDRKSHLAWLQLGWGLAPAAAKPKPGAPDFGTLVATGKGRSAQAVPAGLHPKTQEARSAFFQDYYGSSHDYGMSGTEKLPIGDRTPVNVVVKSQYKAPPQSADERGTGKYNTKVDLLSGTMDSMDAFALQGGELYHDPQGAPEKAWGGPGAQVARMSTSEILYQQWMVVKRAAEADHPDLQVNPLAHLVSSHVAGDALKPLKMILAHERETVQDKATWKNGEDGFYALLALPNCTAAVYLVRDHGTELRISGIEAIHVTAGKSIVISFTTV
jgi:hypothetical protein